MKPPRKKICLVVLISSDFTKINLIFLVIFFSLAFVRNDKGKASFCFAISQSIVRIFSFSFKLSLLCFFCVCGQGPVIKINSNQRYATTAVSSSIIRVIAESGDSNVPLQVQYIQQNRSLDCILSSACTSMHAQGGWGWGLLQYMSYIVCAAVEGMVSTVVWNGE